ncbi:MAG: [FeFe] hydrogenase H-cluster radical SAM maturase HydG [Spirochaetae bacterium HGW-Spirochaetae-1]|jgi:2-iminoacetate synthase|nr:MAG: [FeFe] hydrogenase H-cluster radical SAM maturase HydG [Spirochaetae bacterium HGW-Spirochaetae-1]
MTFIDENKIHDELLNISEDSGVVMEILARARELKGLARKDVARLTAIHSPELLELLYETARYVKETIYGRRLVLFAPLYISNLCSNECTYCAFRAGNTGLERRCLGRDEIRREARTLAEQGHKRILLVTGESYPSGDFRYVVDAIGTVYEAARAGHEIRRVNVNIAPLDTDQFRELKKAKIGTYQLFQETYHRETYASVHRAGKKSDYLWRLTAMDRALESGIDDIGLGVLFGLHDWRFELLALMQHVEHLEQNFGIGPHTVSVPRLEPALGSEISLSPPDRVSDEDFRKIMAILRIAIPYTGIIMSTRESPVMRMESFALGVSQISAGSRTSPGAYGSGEDDEGGGQFSLGDHRDLDEVIADIVRLGYIPSFCTACYRLGRTGADFMDLAKPGEIRHHCDPNALSTFLEYLLDYASPDTKIAGVKLINDILAGFDAQGRHRASAMLEQIRSGRRDVFC